MTYNPMIRRSRPFRNITIIVVAATLAAGAFLMQASAQSEFLRGQGMPYAAFDRLPKRTLR